MLESNCMLIAGSCRGPQNLFTCTAIASHLRRRWPSIRVSYVVLHCGEKWTGSSMVKQVANNCVRLCKTDFKWSFEHTGRSLRLTTYQQDRLIINLAAAVLKKRGTFQITQWAESRHTAPPVWRLIIHCVSAGRQLELQKSSARVFRKKNLLPKEKYSLKELVLERKQGMRKVEGESPSWRKDPASGEGL